MPATSSGMTGALQCPVCGTRYPADSKFCTHDGSPLKAAGPEGDPLIGSVLADRYRIVKLLGEGGMGRVYEASHLNIAKRYALKLLRPNVLDNPEAIARFRQEAWAASSIGHPNIINIDDFATLPDGGVYLAMEFLDGESLAARMQARPLTLDEILHVMSQMVSALSAAHQKNIIHRDIKPENVFLAKTNQGEMVKLLDFGIAKVNDTSGGHLTKTGAVFGTPFYMSPEQALGRPLDHRTDIYSTGVILYELAVGHVPFAAESFLEVLHHHISTEPQRPADAAPGRVDPGLEAIIVKAMAKDRDQRYASMDELLEALRALGQAALGLDPAQLGSPFGLAMAMAPMRSGSAAPLERKSQPNVPTSDAAPKATAPGRVSTPPRSATSQPSLPSPSSPSGSPVVQPVAPQSQPSLPPGAVGTAARGPAPEPPSNSSRSSVMGLVLVGLIATGLGVGGVAWWRGRAAATVEGATSPTTTTPATTTTPVAAATPPATSGAQPEPPKPVTTKPEPAKPEPAKPEPTKPEPTKPEPKVAKADPKAHPNKVDKHEPKSTKPDPKAQPQPTPAVATRPTEPPPPPARPLDPYAPAAQPTAQPHPAAHAVGQPLGNSLVDREVAQRMPGMRRIGGIYKAPYVQEDGRNDYTINLDAGRCYTMFTAGGPGVKEISLYLWDPRGKRAATHRADAPQATFLHCTTMTGPYHVQVKVTDGAGETQFGLYTR